MTSEIDPYTCLCMRRFSSSIIRSCSQSSATLRVYWPSMVGIEDLNASSKTTSRLTMTLLTTVPLGLQRDLNSR